MFSYCIGGHTYFSMKKLCKVIKNKNMSFPDYYLLISGYLNHNKAIFKTYIQALNLLLNVKFIHLVPLSPREVY